jgi:RHS repeat-associated protein
VIARQSHLPFGEAIGGSGQQDKHHFTNYERDGETGTDYAVNRQYSQTTGRFMRPDPMPGSIQDPQSLNKFAYVGDDPINRVDPAGLFAIPVLSCRSEVRFDWEYTLDGGPRGTVQFTGRETCEITWIEMGPMPTTGGGGGGKQMTASECKRELHDLELTMISIRGFANQIMSPSLNAVTDEDAASNLGDQIRDRMIHLGGDPGGTFASRDRVYEEMRNLGRQYGSLLRIAGDNASVAAKNEFVDMLDKASSSLALTLEAAKALQNSCEGVLEGDDLARLYSFVAQTEAELIILSGFFRGVGDAVAPST